MEVPTYLTLKQVLEIYPFKVSTVRHWILHRDNNGLGTSIIKIGQKLYFDKKLLQEWIEDKNKIRTRNL